MKKLTDEEKNELITEFALKNLEDRDDVGFNFEADLARYFKTLDIKKLIIGDKRYIKEIKQGVNDLVLQSYLSDIIEVGLKKVKYHNERFNDE